MFDNAFPHFHEFEKCVERTEEELRSRDIDMILDFLSIDIEKGKDEFDFPISYYEPLMNAYKVQSLDYLEDSLTLLLDYTYYNHIYDIQEIIDIGVIDALMDLANNNRKYNDIIAFKAFCNLINISSNPKYNPLNTEEFFYYLLGILDKPENPFLVACSLSCLNNYCVISSTNRDLVLSKFSLAEIAYYFKQEFTPLRFEAMRLLYSISIFPFVEESIIHKVLKFCTDILEANEMKYFTSFALWAILFLIKNHEHRISESFSDIIYIVGSMLTNKSSLVLVPSLLLLRVMFEYNIPFSSHILTPLFECILNHHQKVQIQAIYAIKSLMKYYPNHLSSFLVSGFFSSFSSFFLSDIQYQILIQGAFLFNDFIIVGGPSVSERLAINGGVSQLIRFLEIEDKELIISTLNAFTVFLDHINHMEDSMFQNVITSFLDQNGYLILENLTKCEDIEIVGIVDSFIEEYLPSQDIV